MKMEIRFGNPVLIFLYSSALLLFGCAIGMYWIKTPSIAIKFAIIGAALIVIHDTTMALLAFLAIGVWIRAHIK